MSDPSKYRTKEEVKEVKEHHDPIDMIKDKLISGGHADEAQLKEIDKSIRDVVSEAADFSQSSPQPDDSELYTDVLL